jgi:NADH-quinone oxidoreductase subunit J
VTEAVSGIAFGLLALACVGGSVAMLATRNVTHAAFWLLEAMLAMAGLFLLLSAEFMAMVQLLVYAGAVAVLLLFVIMLTLRRREDAIRPRDWSWPAAGMAAVFGGLMLVAISRSSIDTGAMPEVVPDVAAFGKILFTSWMLPFEIASLVLLVALVSAVWWSREGDDR